MQLEPQQPSACQPAVGWQAALPPAHLAQHLHTFAPPHTLQGQHTRRPAHSDSPIHATARPFFAHMISHAPHPISLWLSSRHMTRPRRPAPLTLPHMHVLPCTVVTLEASNSCLACLPAPPIHPLASFRPLGSQQRAPPARFCLRPVPRCCAPWLPPLLSRRRRPLVARPTNFDFAFACTCSRHTLL